MKKILFASFCLFVSSVVNAFSVEPMVAELQPSKAKNQIMFKVKNDSTKPLSVVANPLLISFDKEGNEINTDSDDLLVLPLTTTIAANSFQTFVVRYAGEPAMLHSKSYRVAFETANVQVDEDVNAMQMQYQFLTFVNVKPQNPVVEIEQKRTYQKDGKWFLELANRGNTSAFLGEMSWKVGTGSTLNAITESDKRKHLKADFLLPGDTQSFEFTPFKGIAPKSMQVAVSN